MGHEETEECAIDLSAVEMPTGSSAELEKLKESVESNLSGRDLDRILEYCRNQTIDFEGWSSNPLSSDHLDEIERTFSTVEPGVKLLSFLRADPSSEKYKYGKKVLDKIVALLRERQFQYHEMTESFETINTETVTGLLGKAAEKIKESYVDHKFLTIGAIGATLIGAYALWGTSFKMLGDKKERPWFKYAALTGVGLLTGNYLTEIFTDKSAVEHIEGLIGDPDIDDEVLQFLDGQTGLDKVDRQSLRHMWGIGSIPFETFLNAYDHARRNHKDEINMSTLRRTPQGRTLPAKYFNQTHGKAMYQEMFAIVGTKVDVYREQYVENTPETGSRGYYNLREVIFMEKTPCSGGTGASSSVESDGTGSGIASAEEEASEASDSGSSTGDGLASAETSTDEETTSSTGGSGKKKPSAGSAPSERTERVAAGVAIAITTAVPGLKQLGLSESPALGDVELMGYSFDYSSKDYFLGYDVTQHVFKDTTTGRVFAFSISEDMGTSEKEKLERTKGELTAYIEERVARLFEYTGFDSSYSVEWDASSKKWKVKPDYSYTLASQLGNRQQPHSFPLTFEVTEEKTAQLVFGDKKASNLEEMKKIFQNEILEKEIGQQMNNSPETSRLMSLGLEVTGVTSDWKIKGVIAGAPVILEWNVLKNEYVIESLTLSDNLVEALVNKAADNHEFKALFKKFEGAGEKLSAGRWFLDIGQLRWPDSTNNYWEELVKAKKGQILGDYRMRLETFEGKSVAPGQLERAYEESIEKALTDLETLPAELGTAAETSQAAYEQTRDKFEHHGFSDAYATEYQIFTDTILSDFDFNGFAERSDPDHNRILFQLKDIWYQHTKVLKDRPELTATQVQYIRDLNEAIKVALNEAQNADSGFWSRHFDSSITLVEALGIESALSQTPPYERTVSRVADEVVNQNPVMQGLARDSYEILPPDPSNPNLLVIRFKDSGIEWKFDQSTSPPKVEDFALTDDIIKMKAAWLESDPDFNDPFDALSTIFVGMEGRSITWENVTGFDFSDLFYGTVADNRWESLVEYKKQEARLHYQQDLRAVREKHKGNPAAMKAAVDLLDQQKGANMTGQLEAFNQAISAWIANKSAKTPPEKFTSDEFAAIYDQLSSYGYGNASYSKHMANFRRQLDGTDYAGSDFFQGSQSEDIQNDFMNVVEIYTGSLRNTDSADWTKVHDGYMRYVQFKAMTAVHSAHANRKGVTGTWLDDVVGSDEVPEELDGILSYEEFEAEYGADILANKTNPFDPDMWDDVVDLLRKLSEQQGVTPGPVSPEVIKKWVLDLRGKMDLLYNVWDDKIKATNPTDLDMALVNAARAEMKEQQDAYILKVLLDPTNEAKYLKEYQTLLTDRYEMCKKSWAQKGGDWLWEKLKDRLPF